MVSIGQLREYCLSKSMATEDMPFGESTLCFRLMGKIFLLTDLNSEPLRVNLKCDPEKAIFLREEYENILPGFHMNKKHWNTIIIDNSIKSSDIKDWIDHSYQLILDSLPKIIRNKIDEESHKTIVKKI